MKTSIEPSKFRSFLRLLTEIEANDSPMISCFVNLQQPRKSYFEEIEAQAHFIEQRLSGKRMEDYLDALAEIREYLENGLQNEAAGVAIYARWGDEPTVLPMQFGVPLETRLIVDDLPHIYPLIEMKDSYERFVIVVTTETEAKILETTIGEVIREVLAERPEARSRVGREWTQQHYGHHMEERSKQFLREKVRIVTKLMEGGGVNYLVLAGSPALTKRLRNALPKALRERVVATIHGGVSQGLPPLLREALERVAAAENQESCGRAAALEAAVLSGGLGVAGFEATHRALSEGYADMLIVDRDHNDPAAIEELIRLARKSGAGIETVSDSLALRRLSGVGCLLRYLPSNCPVEAVQLAS